jgi:hypothetical protein
MWNLVDRLVRQVDLGEALKHSYRDFHVKGLDYVSLLRIPGQLSFKLYFVPPDTPRVDVGGGLGVLVNPHDHAYSFETHVVKGSLVNVTFEPDFHGHGWWRHLHHSPLLGGRRHAYPCSSCDLRVASRTPWLCPGQSYTSDENDIHSIVTDYHQETILFLIQYATTGRPHTRLFTRDFQPPSTAGLYRRFESADAIGELLRRL